MDTQNQPPVEPHTSAQSSQQSPKPILSPLYSKTMMLLFSIIMLIFISFVGIYFYLASRTNKSTNLASTPTPDLSRESTDSAATANWKTYANSQVGYSFRYPSDWQIQKKCNKKAAEDTVDYVCIMSPNFVENSNGGIQREGLIVISILLGNPTVKLTCKVGSKRSPTITCKEGIFNGFVSTSGFDSSTGDMSKPTHRYLNFDTGSYAFTIHTINKPESSIMVTNIYDQILSTFKFADQNQTIDTSNWKTYRDSKYGYTFKYPSDWGVAAKCDDEPTGYIGIGPEFDQYPYSRCGTGNLPSPISFKVENNYQKFEANKIYLEKTLQFGTAKATYYHYKFEIYGDGYDSPFKEEIVHFVVPVKDKFLVGQTGEGYDIQYYKETFDQILSTFRFD